MKETIDITAQRRDIQIAYNTKHSITPTTIISTIKDLGFKDKKEKLSIPK